MGYSKSKATLDKFYEHIQPLERGEGFLWITEEGHADGVAYKVREALYIANLFPSHYPKLVEASKNLEISVISPSKVQAKVITSRASESSILSGQAVPTHGLTDGRLGAAIGTEGEQTAFTIIDAWRRAQPNNTPINFPNAKLAYQSLVALWNWAQSWKPRLMLMVDGDSVTVGPVESDVEQYAWRPNEEDLPVQQATTKTQIVPPKPY